MKKNRLNGILAAIVGSVLIGCASMPGVTNWKESRFTSPLDQTATVKIATTAIAQIGTVKYFDPVTGTVNGECEQQVEGSVTVFDENGKTMVIVKSKLNVRENSMVIETGDRQKCINHIVEEMQSLGCTLTPVVPPAAPATTP